MDSENKSLEAQKEEVAQNENVERTRDQRCYIPRADIYETNNEIVVVADVPGADENSIDITLDKNILTINAYVDINIPEDYSLAYAEYDYGDYTRSFTLSEDIDREKIQATVKNGVLRLHLGKAGPAKARKISVKAG